MTEEKFKKAFGANIKKIRLSKNIKQEQLALSIGIATTNLSRVENGKDFVKVKTLINLCNSLGVKMKDLFDFE